MIDTLEVIRYIKKIYASDNVINALVGMEKVMDDVNLYAYHNWKKGELVEGPQQTKYDTSATFMWEQNEMPDPEGGMRLTNLGANVEYRKDVKLVPRKIKSYDDLVKELKTWEVSPQETWDLVYNMKVGLDKRTIWKIQRYYHYAIRRMFFFTKISKEKSYLIIYAK